MEHYPILIREAGVSQEKQKMLSSSKGMLGKKKKRNTELSKPLRTWSLKLHNRGVCYIFALGSTKHTESLN